MTMLDTKLTKFKKPMRKLLDHIVSGSQVYSRMNVRTNNYDQHDLYLLLTITSLKKLTSFFKVIGYFVMALPMAKSSATFVTGDIKLSHCIYF
jgi:hypothetical protein